MQDKKIITWCRTCHTDHRRDTVSSHSDNLCLQNTSSHMSSPPRTRQTHFLSDNCAPWENTLTNWKIFEQNFTFPRLVGIFVRGLKYYWYVGRRLLKRIWKSTLKRKEQNVFFSCFAIAFKSMKCVWERVSSIPSVDMSLSMICCSYSTPVSMSGSHHRSANQRPVVISLHQSEISILSQMIRQSGLIIQRKYYFVWL